MIQLTLDLVIAFVDLILFFVSLNGSEFGENAYKVIERGNVVEIVAAVFNAVDTSVQRVSAQAFASM